MSRNNRDDFPPKVKIQLAKRVGYICSYPSCGRLTVSSNSTGDGELNAGTAAHICAAAPQGPRYDATMTPDQRKSVDNGIWLCKIHGTTIDAKDSAFTVEQLHKWKARAQQDAMRRLLLGENSGASLGQGGTPADIRVRLQAAARADLDLFRQSVKWPETAIPLTLKLEDHGEPVSTTGLALVLRNMEDLILVAAPGMGKTATLFQIAEAALEDADTSPIVVPLGDWSVDTASLLDSILRRPAFQGLSETEFRSAAEAPGVILLLDGWNELDSAARQRASAQLRTLQMQLPELSLIISTRKQALDVPIDGVRVDLLPLSEAQQLRIARELRGDAGARMLDQAFRTPGVRDLVSIPLYLVTLLDLPEAEQFPATRDEVLRRFVRRHDDERVRAEQLHSITYGFHHLFLEGLAVNATDSGNTTLPDDIARRSISETEDRLVEEGQISERPQPAVVLSALVDHHALVRSGDPPGYSFQHQQFQEWYASQLVESMIRDGVRAPEAAAKLRREVLNWPRWEESILFACERLARGSEADQVACSEAILSAFDVDPALAAEMIYRANDSVWCLVERSIRSSIERWHTPGKIDPALGFMISSGRPEFLDWVWPLITDENDQVHLSALRSGRRFRASILGPSAVERIQALPTNVRQNVLLELADRGGMAGLDLATQIAKTDSDPGLRAAVIDVMWFRRADRNVVEVLETSGSEVFDRVVRSGSVESWVDGGEIGRQLDQAQQRLYAESLYYRMRSILYGPADREVESGIAELIEAAEIEPDRNGGVVNLIYEAHDRYPLAVAEGMLGRLRAGKILPYRATDLMYGADFSLEDPELLEMSLRGEEHDQNAATAASILGPLAVGQMIDMLFAAMRQARGADGRMTAEASRQYHHLRSRISNSRIMSILEAAEARASDANDNELTELAKLIAQVPHGQDNRGHPFDEEALIRIAGLAEAWGDRLLRSEQSSRAQLAAIAVLIGEVPRPELLPILKRLLDEELRRWQAFKAQAVLDGYSSGSAAVNESRFSWEPQYERALFAIGPAGRELLIQYLLDAQFGQASAKVLAAQWRHEYEPSVGRRWSSGSQYGKVKQKRDDRAQDPDASSQEADAIFEAAGKILGAAQTQEERDRAVALGTIAAALPHGQRESLIATLGAVAQRRARLAFYTALVLSGEVISLSEIQRGIAELFEAAIEQRWIIGDGNEVQQWVSLLPFSERPAEALAVVNALPEHPNRGRTLEALIKALGHAPDDEAEELLFAIADSDAGHYQNYDWREAVFQRSTETAASRFLELVASGAIDEKQNSGGRRIAEKVKSLMAEYPGLRPQVYTMIEARPLKAGHAIFLQAVAESPDADGLLLLVQEELASGVRLAGWQTARALITKEVPSENWKGAYNVLAVTAADIRRRLLELCHDGGKKDAAARCLREIDEVRQEYGIVESDPRHPNLDSGQPWPILVHDPEAGERG